MKSAMVTDAGGIVRLTTATDKGGDTYRAVVRAYAKKMPGFIFSDFQEILLSPSAIVGM